MSSVDFAAAVFDRRPSSAATDKGIASVDVVNVASLEATKSDETDFGGAIRAAAASRAKRATPLWMRDTPKKDESPSGSSTAGAPDWMRDSPAGGAAPAPWADGADGSSASEPPADKDSSASGPSADGGGSLLSDSRGADGDGPEEVPSEVDSKLSDFDDDDLAGLGLQTDSSDGGDGGAA